MDFIEKWFGFSPDGGDGSTELLYIIVVALVLAVIFGRKRVAKLLSERQR
jgi:Sec-independent protein translocase protein TatA